MGDGFNFQKLKSEILALSDASDWGVAKKEWVLTSIYEVDEPETCLCGHFPIKEICSIQNNLTYQTADVGNVCVKRFFGIRSDKVFTALKKIRADNMKALNADAINYFHQRNIINNWEFDFLQNTRLKRDLSQLQMDTQLGINRKVLASVQKRGVS